VCVCVCMYVCMCINTYIITGIDANEKWL
jgi:hypothetical protein